MGPPEVLSWATRRAYRGALAVVALAIVTVFIALINFLEMWALRRVVLHFIDPVAEIIIAAYIQSPDKEHRGTATAYLYY